MQQGLYSVQNFIDELLPIHPDEDVTEVLEREEVLMYVHQNASHTTVLGIVKNDMGVELYIGLDFTSQETTFPSLDDLTTHVPLDLKRFKRVPYKSMNKFLLMKQEGIL